MSTASFALCRPSPESFLGWPTVITWVLVKSQTPQFHIHYNNRFLQRNRTMKEYRVSKSKLHMESHRSRNWGKSCLWRVVPGDWKIRQGIHVAFRRSNFFSSPNLRSCSSGPNQMDLTGSEQPVHIMENLLTQSLLIEMLTTSKNIFATVYADGLQFVMVQFFYFKMVWGGCLQPKGNTLMIFYAGIAEDAVNILLLQCSTG